MGLNQNINAVDVRAAVIDQLDTLLNKAIQTMTTKGITVHLASDAEEARAVIQFLCQPGEKVLRSNGPELREIAVDIALKDIETRLSNMEEVVAVYNGKTEQLHPIKIDLDGLTEEQVLSAIKDYTGSKNDETCLEDAYMEVKKIADVTQWGITTADGVLADTGSLVIAEDQGDVRLTSNIPTRHIAVIGLEKVYPVAEPLLTSVRAAYQFGLGEHTPTFFSFITGPSRTGDIEGIMVCGMHGPLAVDLILLDNGRKQLKENGYEKLLRCLDCGACTEALKGLAAANKWHNMVLDCKQIALKKVRNPDATIVGTDTIGAFICPVGITVEDLKDVLK